MVFDDGADRKRKKRSREIMGDDGFLQHSDDEGDWSDVDDNIYESSRNKTRISKKEAARRRTWASDKDATVAARRMWPSFPRLIVSKVLSTMMDAMIKYDSTKGGSVLGTCSERRIPRVLRNGHQSYGLRYKT